MKDEFEFASQPVASQPAERRLEHWPLDRLKAYARNARVHTRAQVAQIANSIERFGFTNPILARSDGTIAAGHGRLEAAKLLGLAQVPVIVIDGWSEDEFRAYVLADNQLALNAGWDEQLLAAELQELRASKFDLELLGFSSEELARALAAQRYQVGDAEAVPDVPHQAVSKAGDLWICCDHKVLCGDATNPEDADRLMSGERAAMCFTDPPYGVNYSGGANGTRRGKERQILNDALGPEFGAFLRSACASILRVTDGAVYICMSSAELDTLQRAFREAGGKWSTFLIWTKNTFTLGRSDYQRQYEPILYGWREGGPHHWSGARDQGDVWFFDKPVRSTAHPTMKPVALVERAIVNSSKTNDLVFDPFGGSGTTLIAAWRSGRCARLIELDPKYVDVIVRRWQDLTGKAAILDGTGQTFAQVKTARQSQEAT